jgi:uncharacterized membrane protein YdjX (TVP38/TMEM64 family)
MMAPLVKLAMHERQSTTMVEDRSLLWLRAAAIVLVLAIVAIAYRFGVFERVRDPAMLAQTLVELGPWGYIAFVLAYALLQPFGVPGTAFVWAAPLIWPWPTAFALSMTGTMAASVIGFSFARFIARDFVAKRIPERFRKYETLLESRGFRTVFTLRLLFWMPQALHAFLGISKVSFAAHFWGSLLGYVIPLFLVSYFGQRLWSAIRSAPPSVWIFGLAAVACIVAFRVWRKRKRKLS